MTNLKKIIEEWRKRMSGPEESSKEIYQRAQMLIAQSTKNLTDGILVQALEEAAKIIFEAGNKDSVFPSFAQDARDWLKKWGME